MGSVTRLLTKVDHQLDNEFAEELEEGLKEVMAEAPVAPVRPVTTKANKPSSVFEALDKRISVYRQDVTANERAINTIRRDQAIREAELHADLAALTQEMSERRAALDREERERRAKIEAEIVANREKGAAEIRARSALLDASRAALESLLNHDPQPAEGSALQAAE